MKAQRVRENRELYFVDPFTASLERTNVQKTTREGPEREGEASERASKQEREREREREIIVNVTTYVITSDYQGNYYLVSPSQTTALVPPLTVFSYR